MHCGKLRELKCWAVEYFNLFLNLPTTNFTRYRTGTLATPRDTAEPWQHRIEKCAVSLHYAGGVAEW